MATILMIIKVIAIIITISVMVKIMVILMVVKVISPFNLPVMYPSILKSPKFLNTMAVFMYSARETITV